MTLSHVKDNDSSECVWSWNYESMELSCHDRKSFDDEYDNIVADLEEFNNGPAKATIRKFLQYDYKTVADLYEQYIEIRFRIATLAHWPGLEILKDMSNPEFPELEAKANFLYQDMGDFIAKFTKWVEHKAQFYATTAKFFRSHKRIDNIEVRNVLNARNVSRLSKSKIVNELLVYMGDDSGVIPYHISLGYDAIYCSFLAERKFKTLVLCDSIGNELPVVCDDSNVLSLMRHSDRIVRQQAYKLNNLPYADNVELLTSTLSAFVSNASVISYFHGFPNSIDHYFENHGFTNEQYESIMSEIRGGLVHAHEYIRQVANREKFESIHNYDFKHAMPGKRIDECISKMPHEEAITNILTALSPFGSGYVETASRLAASNSRLDIGLVGDGSRGSGAQCIESHICGPMGFIPKIDSWHSLSDTVHELGHMINNDYANKNSKLNPVDKYTRSLTAETVATVHELMMAAAPSRVFTDGKDERESLDIKEWRLDTERVKWVLFYCLVRQAVLSEFEVSMYERAHLGEQLTSTFLTEKFEELTMKYMGSMYELSKVEKYSWGSVEHFFNEPRHYITSYIIACVIAFEIVQQILDGRKGAISDFEWILSQGARVSIDDVVKKFKINLKISTAKAMQTLSVKS